VALGVADDVRSHWARTRSGDWAVRLGALDYSLSPTTAVDLCSVEPLGQADGVKVEHVYGSMYHYRYYGLRLLIDESGTYYLLPKKWNPEQANTYIIDDSDQVRIELSSVGS
jgi:hypothetical protein